MLGFVIGVASGAIQFFLLMQFVFAVTGSKPNKKTDSKSNGKRDGKSKRKSGSKSNTKRDNKSGDKSNGKSGGKLLIFAITQFLFPFAILLLCAFLLTDSLMWVGIGIAASLIASAVIRFILVAKRDK